MKHNWLLSGVFAMMALGAGLAAQTPGQNPTPTPGQGSSTTTAPGQPGNITVSGCVQQAGTMPPAGSATPGATGTSGSATSALGQFVLTNARAGMGTGTGSGGSSAAASSATGAMYYLEGQQAELRDHVGHQVEVTGRLASGSAPSSGSTATSSGSVPSGNASAAPAAPQTGAGQGAAGSAPARAPRLDVQTVKMVAPTCAAR